MLTSRRASSQATMAGVGSVDEELNAMLQSGHHSHAQTTLAGVMTPSSTPVSGSGAGDVHNSFSSSYSSLQGNFSSSAHGRQLSSSRTMNLPGSRLDGSNAPSVGPGSSGRPLVSPASRWPFEEKWVLDAKSEVLESAASLHSNVSNFSSHLEGASPGMNPPLSGGLQRYHSAPSSFLQCLADFNEDAFSQVSSPLGNASGREGLLSPFFTDHLTPIIECAPQQMETDKAVSARGMNEIDQFLSSQNDYGRRSALSTSMLVGKPELRPLARSGGLGASVTDAFGTGPRPLKNNLLRQSSSPADLLANIQDSMDETDPSLQIPTIMSSEESLSGGTSEENVAGNNGRTSMYSRDDSFLVNDTMTSGALWNAPTSPGQLGGKRPRGVPAETTNGTGVNAEASLRIRVGEPGSLTRHLSLPATSRPLSPGLDLGMDELADFSVPCRTRARRGFATHPRSIAERVRRTKISERMKKLQDLVPNMDRQTNTSDMLDEAVEYVKQLQLQVQELTDTVRQLKEMHAKE